MTKLKGFWYMLMSGSILGWLFVIYGLVYPIEQGFFKILWMAVAAVWLVVHPLEIIVTLPIGKKAGVEPFITAVKTILYGFTWWVPLKKGLFKS